MRTDYEQLHEQNREFIREMWRLLISIKHYEKQCRKPSISMIPNRYYKAQSNLIPTATSILERCREALGCRILCEARPAAVPLIHDQ